MFVPDMCSVLSKRQVHSILKLSCQVEWGRWGLAGGEGVLCLFGGEQERWPIEIRELLLDWIDKSARAHAGFFEYS
jgi:hypothetical protein